MYGFPGMKHPSNSNVRLLRLLVNELRVTMQLVTGQAHMRVDCEEKKVTVLKRMINKLCGTIYNLTDDVHIKAVVNSVFDTASVEETLLQLKSINGGERPDMIEFMK